ncbi:MAG TPA: hypothetical protein VF221_06185 [Chloroflexota bacterium]
MTRSILRRWLLPLLVVAAAAPAGNALAASGRFHTYRTARGTLHTYRTGGGTMRTCTHSGAHRTSTTTHRAGK